MDVSNKTLVKNRLVVADREETLFQEAKLDGKNKVFLNLECGNKILTGFKNIDKDFLDSKIYNCEIFEIPVEAESVDVIYCAHTYEAFSEDKGLQALSEWSRVLKVNGRCFLEIPDIEEIAFRILDSTVPEKEKNLYYNILFGTSSQELFFNKKTQKAIDPTKLFKFGFSKEKLRDVLTKLDFSIQEMFTFDGWGIPSIWVRFNKV